jgi:hypothetical protein
MTTRLRSKRLGRSVFQRAYTLRRRTIAITRRTISGSRPRSTKEPIKRGDRMEASESILAISVPAFTKTRVAASMPSWLTQAKVQIFMCVNPANRFRTKNGMAGISRSVNR